MPRGAALVALALMLLSCRSAPVPPPAAPRPNDWPSAVAAAQQALGQERWSSAWALVANRPERTPEREAFLATMVQNLQGAAERAQAEGRFSQANDLRASLALIRSQPWEVVLPPSERPSSPSPAQWLKGSATVIVNRGLKLQNGSAQPDIMIGSGFFVSGDGYLLTNHHVIESEVEPTESTTSRLSLRLPGSKGERLPAKVVGWDKNLDLALLKAEYHPEFVFTLSDGVDPIPGQRLQALGSPGGLEATLTEGIVSSVARPLLAVGEVLQIDAAVNPGNSGGPLLDSTGRVVGVVFAGIRDFQGVSFAIPSSLVRKLLPRLQGGGRAVLPWMGLGLQEDHRGLEVLYVTPRSPADWAGVQPGDRLLAVAGHRVREIAEAQVRLLDFGVDAVVPVLVSRDGEERTIWTTLEPRPDEPLKTAALTDLTSRVVPLAFGVEVVDLAAGVDTTFRVAKVWPGTTADELSLAENDPIEVLDWVADTENKVLRTTWRIKRRLGGYLESVVQLSTPFTSRLFL